MDLRIGIGGAEFVKVPFECYGGSIKIGGFCTGIEYGAGDFHFLIDFSEHFFIDGVLCNDVSNIDCVGLSNSMTSVFSLAYFGGYPV